VLQPNHNNCTHKPNANWRTTVICPKCRHERSELDDPAVPDTTCPKCEVIYAKFNTKRVAVVRHKLKTKKTVCDTRSEEESKRKDTNISIFIGVIFSLLAVLFLYGDGLKYFSLFDKRPDASFYQITKMSKSEMRSFRSDQW